MKHALLTMHAAILLTACSTTPTNNIAEFGLALENASQQINHDFAALENTAIQSQADALAYLTLDQSKDNLCQGSASQILNGEITADISRCNLPLRLDDLRTIINPSSLSLQQQMLISRANQQLTAYARALTELTNAADTSTIQRSALELTTSIGQLNDAYLQLYYRNHLKKEQVITQKKQEYHTQQAHVATAFAAFASVITEEKRRTAIKLVLNEGESVIRELIPLIVAELEKARLHQSMATLQSSELTDDIIQYNQSSIKRPLKHDKAAKSIISFYQRYQQIQVAALKDQQVINMFEQIAISHKQITEQVNKDRFSSKEIIAAINTLNNHYRDLSNFEQLIANCQGSINTDESGFLVCNIPK